MSKCEHKAGWVYPQCKGCGRKAWEIIDNQDKELAASQAREAALKGQKEAYISIIADLEARVKEMENKKSYSYECATKEANRASVLEAQVAAVQAREQEAIGKYHDEIRRGRLACEEIVQMELKAQREKFEAEIKRVEIINADHVVERNNNRVKAEQAESLAAMYREALEKIAKDKPSENPGDPYALWALDDYTPEDAFRYGADFKCWNHGIIAEQALADSGKAGEDK